MEDIKKFFESRTSVRRYEREAIPQEKLDVIYAAIRNTPNSYNGQQFSVIDISDQSIKEQLYEVIGQKQVKTCNHFFVFCADFNKIGILAKAKGINVPQFHHTLDGVLVGTIDAALAMQSAVQATQMCGLGSCCIGFARTANPEKLAEMLKLPKGVFVVCGLAVGVPREQPDVKPKQPLSLVIHQNAYRSDDMLDELKEYDNTISEYNRNRAGTQTDNDWCAHILEYYHEALDYHTKDYIIEQGFDLLK